VTPSDPTVTKDQPARPRWTWWTGPRAVALVVALVLVSACAIAPNVGRHPSATPQPTVLALQPGDPTYTILQSAVTPDGSLWFTEERFSGSVTDFSGGPAKIGHVTPSGQLTEYPLADGNTFPVGQTPFVVGSDGDLWFVEQVGGLDHTVPPHEEVARIDATGHISGYALPFPAPVFYLPQVTTPLVLGPDGNLWFGVAAATRVGATVDTTTKAEELAHITPAGAISAQPLTGLPQGASYWINLTLTIGPDGNFWTEMDHSDNTAPLPTHRIARISSAGAVILYPIPLAGASAYGFAPDADGNVWFIELPDAAGSARVARITPAGQIAEYTLPNPRLQVAPALVKNGDSMWFVAQATSCSGSGSGCHITQSHLDRVSPGGAITEYAVPSGSVVANLYNGPNGNLYYVGLSDTLKSGNNRLGRVSPSGQIVEYTVPTEHESAFNLVAGSGNVLWLTGSPQPGQAGISRIFRITLPPA
jgi:virginiamycin B lyase